ncbi:Methyltransferase domain-containing protein [Malonomonas rubra DSM 5091]|uniref:Methyltransferase domain-containing protein n=1 Tax=Malonomonas rubra DSM 5091 TaxID=1122189 RepID=A0A1M6DSF3_MALRU|nr:class I SAM-dependent methyltransferase [Malonomonas rubra]SHI76131.1 Methyltransferase domain-containing protein [Malonomonas rubra DSM 5091]
MDVQKHRESFDKIYKDLPTGNSDIVFPLRDIDAFDLGPSKNRAKDYYCYMYRRFSCHILNEIKLEEGLDVLVLGCGQGTDEKNIKSLCPSANIRSTDISAEMIKRAIDGASPSTFALASAENMPFPDNSFDRIVSREVIEHVDKPQQMLNEVSRMLRDNGVAVITTENEESLSRKHAGGEFIKRIIRLFFRKNASFDVVAFKDEAPTLREMKALAEKTDLDLCDYFWDGALYQSLPSLYRWLKGNNLASLAYKLSALENSRFFAPLFCDQAKYVFRKKKPINVDVMNSPPDFVCPVCQGELELLVDELNCPSHGSFPVASVPDFVFVGGEKKDVQTVTPLRDVSDLSKSVEMSFWCKLGRYVERRILHAYSFFLVLCGCLIILFLPKNPDTGSKRIDGESNLVEFIKFAKS